MIAGKVRAFGWGNPPPFGYRGVTDSARAFWFPPCIKGLTTIKVDLFLNITQNISPEFP
jgi:hypothetical protein